MIDQRGFAVSMQRKGQNTIHINAEGFTSICMAIKTRAVVSSSYDWFKQAARVAKSYPWGIKASIHPPLAHPLSHFLTKNDPSGGASSISVDPQPMDLASLVFVSRCGIPTTTSLTLRRHFDLLRRAGPIVTMGWTWHCWLKMLGKQ